MTITHLSHFDLELVVKTEDNVVLEGTLAACKRMTAAHGLEVERYEGRILGSDCGHAVYAPADASNFAIVYLNRGMILKTRDAFCLVMPSGVWNERV